MAWARAFVRPALPLPARTARARAQAARARPVRPAPVFAVRSALLPAARDAWLVRLRQFHQSSRVLRTRPASHAAELAVRVASPPARARPGAPRLPRRRVRRGRDC